MHYSLEMRLRSTWVRIVLVGLFAVTLACAGSAPTPAADETATATDAPRICCKPATTSTPRPTSTLGPTATPSPTDIAIFTSTPTSVVREAGLPLIPLDIQRVDPQLDRAFFSTYWTLDGRAVVFLADRDCPNGPGGGCENMNVYWYHLGTDTLRRLTDITGYDLHFDWETNHVYNAITLLGIDPLTGNVILARYTADPQQTYIYSFSPNAPAPVDFPQMTLLYQSQENERISSLDFSPDGERVAFVQEIGDQRGAFEVLLQVSKIIIADRDLTPLLEWSPPENYGIQDLAWSPDGAHLAYVLRWQMVRQEGGGVHVSTGDSSLHVMNIENGFRSEFLTIVAPYNHSYGWSPDGEWLMVFSANDWERLGSVNTHQGSLLFHVSTRVAVRVIVDLLISPYEMDWSAANNNIVLHSAFVDVVDMSWLDVFEP